MGLAASKASLFFFTETNLKPTFFYLYVPECGGQLIKQPNGSEQRFPPSSLTENKKKDNLVPRVSPSLAPGGGKRRDPGNEVEEGSLIFYHLRGETGSSMVCVNGK